MLPVVVPYTKATFTMGSCLSLSIVRRSERASAIVPSGR